MDKHKLRAKYRALRKRECGEPSLKSSAVISSNFFSTVLPVIPDGIIMCYVSIKGEVDTSAILKELLRKGRSVCVPYLKEKRIIPCLISKRTAFKKSAFGIPQPRSLKPVKSRDISAVITPGLAFDRNGNRLGFGGGYFDRFLAALPASSLKIGTAFSYQICGRLPGYAHDVKMDLIITEKGFIVPAAASPASL
ncbi:MAG TPA: 5-formyltetrahydrofolate cyclo-ligase [bacterium]|nr:5-formyltetrahydrofolate cyclo-ligase [bacterium]